MRFSKLVLIWVISALLLPVLLLASSASASPAVQATPVSPATSSPYPAIKAIGHGEGIVTWLVQKKTLPIIDVILTFRQAGSAYDPDGKEGLATMLAEMLDEGSGNLEGPAFRNKLNDYGIQIATEVGRDDFTIHLRTLTQHQDVAFELLNAMLLQPHFEKDAANKVKRQMQSEIAKSLEDAGYVAEITWYQKAFGAHPYSKVREGTHETVESISRDDLIAFMRSRFHKKQLQISAVGDVDDDTLKRHLSPLIDQLPSGSRVEPLPVATFQPDESAVFMDTPQTQIIFGLSGIAISDPRFFDALLLNHVMGGGGFESRLVNQIREHHGLTYSIQTSLVMLDRQALLIGTASTGNEKLAEMLTRLKEEFQMKKPITEAELTLAKQNLTGSFLLRLDSNRSLASYLDFMQTNGLPREFLAERNQKIAAVTLENVQQLARDWLAAGALHIAVVGKTE